MENYPKNERTFVIMKPDAIQRGLVGELTCRLERLGLKLVAVKMVKATEDQCWAHYNKDDAWYNEKGQRAISDRQAANLPVEKSALEYGKDIMRGNVAFMTACPIIPMVWQGNKAVEIVKKIVGATAPLASVVGTIRGDYALDSYDLAGLDGRAVRNLIHCSDQVSEAEREIKIWFTDADELFDYHKINEEILYNPDLSGLAK